MQVFYVSDCLGVGSHLYTSRLILLWPFRMLINEQNIEKINKKNENIREKF